MKIISHRAINARYPENSLQSICWAFQNGYGIETDVRVNKEGSLVIIHDENGKRLFGNPKKIIDMTDKECRSLVYNGYEKENIRLCFFEEVCKSYKEIGNDVTMALHIKDIQELKVIEKTVELLRKYKLQNSSFLVAVDNQTLPLINLVKEKYSGIKAGLHLPENSPLYTKPNFKKADIIWLDEETGKWLTPKMADLAKKTNSLTYCMSPEFVPNNIFQQNYKKRWSDFLAMKFDAIVTDHADELKEFIKNNKKL
ncbi:MAG: glycerophosphodiester phosphodiesterase family protein [Nanoarchaeota archaeon]